MKIKRRTDGRTERGCRYAATMWLNSPTTSELPRNLVRFSMTLAHFSTVPCRAFALNSSTLHLGMFDIDAINKKIDFSLTQKAIFFFIYSFLFISDTNRLFQQRIDFLLVDVFVHRCWDD